MNIAAQEIDWLDLLHEYVGQDSKTPLMPLERWLAAAEADQPVLAMLECLASLKAPGAVEMRRAVHQAIGELGRDEDRDARPLSVRDEHPMPMLWAAAVMGGVLSMGETPATDRDRVRMAIDQAER